MARSSPLSDPGGVRSTSTSGSARQIAVPGSVANLGPGFDALSVAVQLYLTLDVVDVRPGAPGQLQFTFVGGQKATETGFRSQPLAKVRILHLAVHGVSSSVSPERAALVLARGANDDNDGLLQAREISEMNLSAELVTLSACDTGVGRLVGQEGIVNLVRAFLFAGARSVVASLWAADDVFTISLMKRFYANLAKGMDRGAALQQAKVELIEQFSDQAVPFFWAGFTMVGDGSKQIRFSK
jgi:CHAT domain-containing protein